MMNGEPLMFDFFCGLGGATQGFLEEGWECIGVDNERHDYGNGGYPGHLILQDILTFHGSQAKDADFLWFSPPCQFFSYCAMPWSRAKRLAEEVRNDPVRLAKELELFDACFRIQREASEAAGHHIPLIVENVRGAQPWVGPAKANYGSFYLWGDIGMANGNIICGNRKELLPVPRKRPMKCGVAHRSNGETNFHGVKAGTRLQADGTRSSSFADTLAAEGYKTTGMNWSDQSKRGQDFTRIAGMQAGAKNLGFRFDGSGGSFQTASVEHTKNSGGGSWFNVAHNTTSGLANNPVSVPAHRQISEGWRAKHYDDTDKMRLTKSNSRKAASAMIAKIPFPLASWVARCFNPEFQEGE